MRVFDNARSVQLFLRTLFGIYFATPFYSLDKRWVNEFKTPIISFRRSHTLAVEDEFIMPIDIVLEFFEPFGADTWPAGHCRKLRLSALVMLLCHWSINFFDNIACDIGGRLK